MTARHARLRSRFHSAGCKMGRANHGWRTPAFQRQLPRSTCTPPLRTGNHPAGTRPTHTRPHLVTSWTKGRSAVGAPMRMLCRSSSVPSALSLAACTVVMCSTVVLCRSSSVPPALSLAACTAVSWCAAQLCGAEAPLCPRSQLGCVHHKRTSRRGKVWWEGMGRKRAVVGCRCAKECEARRAGGWGEERACLGMRS